MFGLVLIGKVSRTIQKAFQREGYRRFENFTLDRIGGRKPEPAYEVSWYRISRVTGPDEDPLDRWGSERILQRGFTVLLAAN